MTIAALLGSTLLGFVAGVLIGCIGVGGVIIVPILVQFGGVPVFTAIATAMAGYILTGVVGTWAYFRHGTLDWPLARFLCVGAMPGAVAGSLVAKVTPSWFLELIIGLTTLLPGIYALIKNSQGAGEQSQTRLSRPAGGGLGIVTGFVSSLTGTGGPAILIPLLLWLDLPVLKTVGLAQIIQLPIAGLATITNAASGKIDLTLGLLLGVGLSAGTWLGARIAHNLNQSVLNRLVASMLFAVGLLMLFKAARH